MVDTSSLISAAADALGFGGGGAAAGGRNLEKARLHITEGKHAGKDVEFHYNPDNVKVDKTVQFKEHPTQGADSGEKEFTHGTARTLTIGQLYFDTYETKKNVRTEFIDRLEELAHYDTELHRPPKVRFVWGKFMAENDPYNSGSWYVEKVTTEYVMFLDDGTPVRAKVTLSLKEATSLDEQLQNRAKHSPDHAKVYTVQRGDTLQTIAYREYDNPAEWKRIAEANGIDDPLAVEPGTRLLVPPIIK